MLDDVVKLCSNLESVLDFPWQCPRLGDVGFVEAVHQKIISPCLPLTFPSSSHVLGHDPTKLLRILHSRTNKMDVGSDEDVPLVDVVRDEVSAHGVGADQVAFRSRRVSDEPQPGLWLNGTSPAKKAR